MYLFLLPEREKAIARGPKWSPEASEKDPPLEAQGLQNFSFERIRALSLLLVEEIARR